ncbi:MAG: hypothetical protein ACFFBR_03805 [Promethearchaeota archaeon]
MGIYFGLWGEAWTPFWGTLTDGGSGNKIFFNDVNEQTLEVVPYYYDWPFFIDPETVAGI